jgi:hypothetical protein
MEFVYHIVAIRVNKTSWAHVWRLRFRYLGTGYDTRGLWWLELWHLCGLRILLCEFLRVALDLQPCLCIVGGDQRQRSYTGHYRLLDKLWLSATF